ncbi:MAG: helix-turn-helix transcriptional regulator [Gammaproteobacteria bacterium]|nr:helix-turn-helix transcriptional regulator [Gammaproteobacteria bacterium]MBP6050432.1 helix-turn-helix transcriptional regulator [Pseudomonadales bacterium]MBK6583649.1 helix-turn-helix transcriptional regulator [Gammaproteobacteria bacterium]MBK7169845.1 helix-turn-helix transcriptional regulator [Gammaproteobacteria bacterium]MBK7727538.1 helix-turn-helix transcriptional regulator [Gammaproteobacteria bacterium]
MKSASEHQSLLTRSPIARALAVIGDRWTMVVLREMFSGATRFGELAAATGASRATLTKRLRAMVDNGLLYQSPYQTRPPRFEYRLTVKGSALYDTALAAWAWESRWTQAARRNLPMRLTHRSCGHRFTPVAVCGRCGTAISIRDIRFRAGVVSETQQEYLNDGSLRRSSTFSVAAGTGSGMFLHFIDVVADHWTPLVLAATFMGLRRYDELRRELGVATNILAHRLKLLVEAGVLQPQPGRAGARRLEYRLTDKGRELIVPTLAIHLWSMEWMPADSEPSMKLLHSCSARPLKMRMECNRCHGALRAQDVAAE